MKKVSFGIIVGVMVIVIVIVIVLSGVSVEMKAKDKNAQLSYTSGQAELWYNAFVYFKGYVVKNWPMAAPYAALSITKALTPEVAAKLRIKKEDLPLVIWSLKVLGDAEDLE